MKKYKLICLALCLVLLAGCASNDLSESVFPSGSEANISDHLAVTETETPDAEDKDVLSQEVESNSAYDAESVVEPSGSDSLPSQPEAETRTETPGSPSEEPKSPPEPTEAPVVEPVEAKPSETEPTITNPSSEAVPETATAPEPSFDVSTYVSYAKSYGQGIGLTLDSSAVSCWDDPIAANVSCIYLERDIRDRLDWYLASGYSAFWVWSVDNGGSNYHIYIGYA